MNTQLLMSKIVLHGYNTKDFCEVLGISRSAFYRKMNGETEFVRAEINRMIYLLELTESEISEIFFTR